MKDDWKSAKTETERLAAWYRRLEQAAEEQRRRQEGQEQPEPAPAPSARPEPARPWESAGRSGGDIQPPTVRPLPAPRQAPPAPEATPEAAPAAGETPPATTEPAAPDTVPALRLAAEAVLPAGETAAPPAAESPAAPTPPAGPRAGIDPETVQHFPPHIRALLLEPERETAQRYYARPFKETRAQLIERLLDPPLTLEETARVLNVCPMTVRRYTNRGLLPHFRTAGDQRRFRLSEVLAFLERHGRLRDEAGD